MTLTDGIMIAAILLAPLCAVQVQKILEKFRDKKEVKIRIFKTLMATRGATLSLDHVKALNMIDLEFYGPKYKTISNAWKSYLDHLGERPPNEKEEMIQIWIDKSADLFTDLLIEMGKPLNYEFDPVHIKKGIYTPQGHETDAQEILAMRRGILNLLYGDKSIKIVIQDPNSE